MVDMWKLVEYGGYHLTKYTQQYLSGVIQITTQTIS
jgi:hypothetical protein